MSEKIDAMFNNQIDSGNSLIPVNFQGSQNTYNDYQNNVIQKEMIIRLEARNNVVCFSFAFIFFIFIVVAVLINLITSDKSYQMAILIISVILAVLIIVFFLYLSLNTNYIKLIKDKSSNLLIVKKINFLNCSKSTLYFNLKNVILDIIKYQTIDEDYVYNYEALAITKIFNNSSEIDLNRSNIKKMPVQNLYHVITGIRKNIYTSKTLRKFLGINPETESPIKFNINKYMGKSDINPNSSDYNPSRYMKMSDYFFTYFLKVPCCYCCGITTSIIIATLTLIYVICPIVIIIFQPDAIDILPTTIMLIAMLGIPLIIIICNIIAIKKYSLRIDIIYSKNFDTIFIALLNHDGTSYKKTFIKNINVIERFTFENDEDSYNKSILKVVYKDKIVEDIFRIDESKFSLNGLSFILNEKISNYKEV